MLKFPQLLFIIFMCLFFTQKKLRFELPIDLRVFTCNFSNQQKKNQFGLNVDTTLVHSYEVWTKRMLPIHVFF